MFLFLALVLSAVAILVLANVSTVRANARLQRLAERGLANTSASLPKNTTRCLNTREELAQFVGDLRSLASDLPLTTITARDKFEGFYVSCATSESSEPVLRACLSQRLLMSLTLQDWQSLEYDMQQAVQRNGGVVYLERRW